MILYRCRIPGLKNPLGFPRQGTKPFKCPVSLYILYFQGQPFSVERVQRFLMFCTVAAATMPALQRTEDLACSEWRREGTTRGMRVENHLRLTIPQLAHPSEGGQVCVGWKWKLRWREPTQGNPLHGVLIPYIVSQCSFRLKSLVIPTIFLSRIQIRYFRGQIVLNVNCVFLSRWWIVF